MFVKMITSYFETRRSIKIFVSINKFGLSKPLPKHIIKEEFSDI